MPGVRGLWLSFRARGRFPLRGCARRAGGGEGLFRVWGGFRGFRADFDLGDVHEEQAEVRVPICESNLEEESDESPRAPQHSLVVLGGGAGLAEPEQALQPVECLGFRV